MFVWKWPLSLYYIKRNPAVLLKCICQASKVNGRNRFFLLFLGFSVGICNYSDSVLFLLFMLLYSHDSVLLWKWQQVPFIVFNGQIKRTLSHIKAISQISLVLYITHLMLTAVWTVYILLAVSKPGQSKWLSMHNIAD